METIKGIQPVLEQVMDALAGILGENCEVVLHDLKGKTYENSIVSIVNGELTGRKIGDPSTNRGLKILRGQLDQHENEIGYISRTKDGKVLKSSSVYFKNDEGDVIGSLCINYDISALLLAETTLKSITAKGSQISDEAEHADKEYFVSNINNLLTQLIEDSMEEVGKPCSFMSKEEKKRGIQYLDEKGAFLIKKSSDIVCQSYDISRNALYNFLEEIREE